jgi:hypothetical protein
MNHTKSITPTSTTSLVIDDDELFFFLVGYHYKRATNEDIFDSMIVNRVGFPSKGELKLELQDYFKRTTREMIDVSILSCQEVSEKEAKKYSSF